MDYNSQIFTIQANNHEVKTAVRLITEILSCKFIDLIRHESLQIMLGMINNRCDLIG